MKTAKLSVIVALFVLLALAGCSQKEQQNPAQNNTAQDNAQNTGTSGGPYRVDIKDFSFSPAQITIKAGETVTWRNADSAGHTVTSDSGSELDSPLLNITDPYSHVFATPGIYTYHCTAHPNMKGTIIVQ